MTHVKFQNRLINKLALALAVVLVFSVALSSFLNYSTFQKNYRQLLQNRVQIVLDDTRFAVEYGLGLGLKLNEQTQIGALLTQALESDEFINAVIVVNNQSEVLFEQGDTELARKVLLQWQQAPVSGEAVELDDQLVFSMALTNSFDQTEGHLILFYDQSEYSAFQRSVTERLAQYAGMVIGVAIFAGLLIIYLILRPTLRSLSRMLTSLSQLQDGQKSRLTRKTAATQTEQQVVALQKLYQGKSIPEQEKAEDVKAKGNWLILGTTLTLIIVATVVSAWLQLDVFKQELRPQEEKKALEISSQIAENIDYLLEIGVPFDRIRGLEQEFQALQSTQPDLQLIALQMSDGQLRYQSGDIPSSKPLEEQFNLYRYPILYQGDGLADVVIGIDPLVMEESLKEISFDILAVIAVAGLLAGELILFIVSYTITTPMTSLQRIIQKAIRGDFSQVMDISFKDEVGMLGHKLNQLLGNLRSRVTGTEDKTGKTRVLKSSSLNFVRPPLFLLVFSESMSLSFFPIYVESMYEPIAGLSKSMVISLPISAFMAIWALSLPMAGQWSDNVGRRKAFIIGALLTAVGLAASGFVDNFYHLLVVRCFTAIGYAIVFITAQGLVTDNTDSSNRTKGMATFLSGFFSGLLCGAAIGGILADRIGFDATFYLSAAMSLASALFVAQFFTNKEKSDTPPTKLAWRDFTILMKNRYFIAITLFSAIPAKITLTGFLYYAVPLYMQLNLAESQSSTGRILMAYGLAIILVTPLSARIVDHYNQKKLFICLGGLMAGIALVALYLIPSIHGVLLAIMLIGIGHAIGVAPQISLLTELMQDDVRLSMGKVIGIYRMTERVGNIAGPILAALLIAALGFNVAFLWFAGFLFINAVIMLTFLAAVTLFPRKAVEVT